MKNCSSLLNRWDLKTSSSGSFLPKSHLPIPLAATRASVPIPCPFLRNFLWPRVDVWLLCPRNPAGALRAGRVTSLFTEPHFFSNNKLKITVLKLALSSFKMWFPTGCAQAFWERELQPHLLPGVPRPSARCSVPGADPSPGHLGSCGHSRCVWEWRHAVEASSFLFHF